jgi:Putative transposase
MGVWCVLHTWTRPLASPPHVHGLVPAGAVSPARTPWPPARTSSLGPVQARSKRLRGRFRALVRQERPDRAIPEVVWAKGWVVYGQPAVHGPEKVLHDVGRSVHRMALPKSRLLALADGHIGCRYRDAPAQRWPTRPRPAAECLRRCRPQVLPRGFHNVRDDGLWSPAHRPLRHHLQRCLSGPEPSAPCASPAQERQPPAGASAPLQAGRLCPPGGQGWLVVVRLLPRPQRGPPGATARPCGRPMPAASGPRVPEPVAPSHPSTPLPNTLAGSLLPLRPAALRSPPAFGSSPPLPTSVDHRDLPNHLTNVLPKRRRLS